MNIHTTKTLQAFMGTCFQLALPFDVPSANKYTNLKLISPMKLLKLPKYKSIVSPIKPINYC